MKNYIKLANNVVFFIHIPKCAGTSLGAFFNHQLRSAGSFFWHGQDGDINQLASEHRFSSADESEAIRFMGGHFTYGAVGQIISDTDVHHPTICSVVRDPIAQAESYFHWITSESAIKGAKHPLYEHCKDMTPEEFFSDETMLSEVSNIQSKYLLGVECGMPNSVDIESVILSLLMQGNFYVADVSRSDVLVSKMAELMFLKKSSEDQIARIPRENVSGVRKFKFDEATVERLKHIFWGDMILYETLRNYSRHAVNNVFF